MRIQCTAKEIYEIVLNPMNDMFDETVQALFEGDYGKVESQPLWEQYPKVVNLNYVRFEGGIISWEQYRNRATHDVEELEGSFRFHKNEATLKDFIEKNIKEQ